MLDRFVFVGRLIALTAAALLLPSPALAAPCDGPVAVCATAQPAALPLLRKSVPATVLVDAAADPAVLSAARNFAADLGRVGGTPARVVHSAEGLSGPVVIIGVAGQSPLVDALAARGLVATGDLRGEWEAFRQQVAEAPWPGVERALVIAGSDRRGAVFGTYDLSERIGVSPWHWFADVPTTRRSDVWITPGARRDQPAVKYRGFFINDEAPAFSTWTTKKFGGANAKAYAHIFELLLRLKGNYIWPAMWAPRAFNADDPENIRLADAMGVVMGTSHHEPLTRAQDEWHRNKESGVTGGKWDYRANGENLRTFWRGGIERLMSKGDGKGYEALITVGMRGDGDEAMAEDTAIPLLEQVVADQRKIIAEVTGRPAEQTPQVWALYKEVQDYYDHGMQVPDDVTLLFADDNWGQVRRLPPLGAKPRKGGYGVYYHFDYVGAPRNYKWLDTVQIEKTWQQMDLAWSRGVRTIWIVNVGDIKPEEVPLDFFMDHAWNPAAMDLGAMARWQEEWAAQTFGPAHAKEIGAILTRYGQLAARRKPELIDPASFALGQGTGPRLDGGEFGAMVAEWDALEARVDALGKHIRPDQRSAWFQLVEHKVRALGNLYRLYYNVAWNRRLAPLGDARANTFAASAEAAFARDRALSDRYHALEGGKWDGMMLQTKIGYTTWQQPEADVMPAVTRVAGKARPIRFLPARFPAAADAIGIEAARFAAARSANGIAWRVIPDLGRTAGAVASFPQDAAASAPGEVTLDYAVTLKRAGEAWAEVILSPTLDPEGQHVRRLGVSVGTGPVQVITDQLMPSPTAVDHPFKVNWTRAVSDNASRHVVRLGRLPAGRHTLRLHRIDANVVVQKLVFGSGEVPESYLGAPPAAR